MKKLSILFICLVLVAVLVLAESQQNDEEFSKKQWSNALLLGGTSATVVGMLLELPSKPISIDDYGEPVIHDAYFYRENDKRGNPYLGALIQVSDSSLLTVSIVYNANKGKKK